MTDPRPMFKPDPGEPLPSAGVPPWVVALIRGVIEAAVLAVLAVLIVAVGEVKTGSLAPWAPVAVLALRQLEGIADTKIDPTRQRATGGKAAT